MFHSQFQLNNDLYRDNNNFIQFNTAIITNKQNAASNNFLSHEQGPVWTADNAYTKKLNVSTDLGMNYDTVS